MHDKIDHKVTEEPTKIVIKSAHAHNRHHLFYFSLNYNINTSFYVSIVDVCLKYISKSGKMVKNPTTVFRFV